MKYKKADHFTLFDRLVFKSTRQFMSDKTYAQWMMKRRFGGSDIENPKTLNEKIQWLKLYNRHDIQTKLVDKYEVRDYISSELGEQYLTKLYGVWEKAEDINFDELPESFVLKTTQASATNIIVKDKSTLNISETITQLNKWLEINYYKVGREWAYKNVKPRIICEEMLADQEGKIPTDFKIFCFNGKPEYVQCDLDRFEQHEKVFYDMQWNKQNFSLLYPWSNKVIPKPEKFDDMITFAKQLSAELPFCRVDFYTLPDIIFGEITLYPGNGTSPFLPAEWDLTLGEMLTLPETKKL